jgi:Tfp pilus assembly protein PilF
VALSLLVLLAAMPAGAARKSGRGLVTGVVTSQAEGRKLAGVSVTFTATDGTESATVTDKRGRFSIRLASGEYVVALEGEGYARFEAKLPVLAGGEQEISVDLLDAEQGRRSAAAQAYNSGIESFRAGDKAAAKMSLLEAVEADPTLPEPHKVLAGIYLEEGAFEEAAAAAVRFLAERPDDRPARITAYEAYRKLGDASRASEMRQQLAGDAELAPKLAVHAFNEGAMAKQEGDAATAAARFAEALALDAGMTEAHFALATVEFEAARFAEALTIAEQGLTLEPTSAQGLRLRFLIHDVEGRQEAAEEAFGAYAEVDPPGAAALMFRRGEAAYRDGDLERARHALAKVVQIVPEHAAGHRVLGLTHLTTDAELARDYLERFLELAPDDSEAATVEEILANL